MTFFSQNTLADKIQVNELISSLKNPTLKHNQDNSMWEDFSFQQRNQYRNKLVNRRLEQVQNDGDESTNTKDIKYTQQLENF